MISPPRPAPYGTWSSPVTEKAAASHPGRAEWLGCVGDEVWWTELRPGEGGRQALLCLRDGERHDVLPAPWNVRNSVHEYGGRPWTGHERTARGPLVVFTHHSDQRLYAYAPEEDAAPRALTPPAAGEGRRLRWCAPRVAPAGDEVWCVLEEHTGPRPGDVRRVLAAVPLDGSAAGDRGRIRELTGDGPRFLTSVVLSPDGERAAWLSWDHPDMPWDATRLHLARIGADGDLHGQRTLTLVPDGEEGTAPARESVAQVEWYSPGELIVTSDRSGWWNLYRVDAETGHATALHPAREEFAGAMWQVGMEWFRVLPDGRIAVLHGHGRLALGILDPATGALTDVAGPWTEWAPTLAVRGDRVVGVAAGPASGYEIVETSAGTRAARAIAGSRGDSLDPDYCPLPEPRTFEGADGRDIQACLYRPRNPRFTGPAGERTPFVVWVHGGPTARTPKALDPQIAYFASRGIGVVAVDHSGSTGYGRAYRERLRDQWGVGDVRDCADVVAALVAEGVADPARVAIRGGSAGGWTAAASLTSPQAGGRYACAAIHFPLLDAAATVTGGTHDFESRYVEGLIGRPDEVPERFAERSPIHHAERVTTPFALFHGAEDPVCPADQCDRFLARLKNPDLVHTHLLFAGEGHGFRREENIIAALKAELRLYLDTFSPSEG
ncbi:acyl-peptide hydrolase [Streptomyces malaysiense]|uniref:Acyl-peptide hydrolase n=2 Tax=Streptomyces malaysiense TaxID=1428626 RepID=A0A1J4Q166_9ACTN|nr:prolyl oligopeptidase family serine peptidase [Streptomyces malaysiense]OIK26875.1 acyl-peptide hydrolase [Streptomyces malaysiense]